MGLIAHYRLDGDATDAVGDNHGTAVDVEWGQGKIGGAADLVTGASGIVLDTDNAFNFLSSFSISAWVLLKEPSVVWTRIVQRDKHNGYQLDLTPANHLRIHCLLEDGTQVSATSSTPLAVGEWVHCAGTVGDNTLTVYLGGEIKGSREYTGNLVNTPNGELNLGRHFSGQSVNGLIDDVRIYDHALSAREVRDLSLAPALQVLSGDGLDNTADAGNTLTVTDAPAVLDSTSIAFWIYPTTTSRRQTVWNNGYGGEGTINLESDGKLNFYSGPNGGDTGGYQSDRSGVLPLNTWTHVVAIRDMVSQEFRFYLNGVSSTIASHTLTSIGKTDFDLQIGTGYTSDFIGKLCDVKQFAGVLTPAQIQELYQQRASIDSGGSVHAGSGEVISGVGPAGLQHVNVTSMDGAYFNGYDSYAYYVDEVGDLQPSEISVSAWVYVVNPSSWKHILSIGNILNNSESWTGCAYLMWLTNSNLEVILDGSSYRSPRPLLPEDTWVRIGFTFDGSRVKVFVGESKFSDEAYSNPINYNGRNVFQLGGHNRYSWYQGGIRDVAIVGRAVSESEFLGGLGPDTPDLISWLPMRDDTTTINSRGRLGKPISEVGVTRGLVTWYPLMGDTFDYAGTNHAVNNGAVATAEGYEFDGVDDYMDLPDSLGYLGQVSAFAMFRRNGTASNGYHIVLGGAELEVSIHDADYLRTGIYTPARHVSNHGSGLMDGKWHQVGFTFDGATKAAYIDGVLVGNMAVSGTLLSSFANRRIGRYGPNTSHYLNGTLRDIRIHNVALTPEEVAMQAKLALNPETKTAMTNSCLYTQGQIKEVIC